MSSTVRTIVVWVWGSIITAIIYISNGNLAQSMLWLGAGLLVGAVGERVLITFACYLQNCWTNVVYGENHLLGMVPDESGEADEAAVELAVEQHTAGASLAIPWFAGLILGPLWGSIFGVLLHLGWSVDASLAIIGGIVVTSIVMAQIIAIGCLFVVPRHARFSGGERWKWRLLMILSPILSIPVLMHGMIRSIRRRHRSVGVLAAR